MMKNVILALGISGAVLLSGCATNIKHPSAYAKQNLGPTEIMPTKGELTRDRVKVVIFDAEDSNIELAKNAKIGHSVASSLEKHIAITGAEIVDRNIAQQLKQEIQLAEMKGKSDYQGPNVADYAVTGTISTASVGSKFSEATQWQDKEGKWYTNPAKCTYSANVAANLRIYKLPALSFSKAIDIDDSVSTSQETRRSNCPFPSSAQKGLLQKAASEAVNDARTEFQNHFAKLMQIIERH